MRILRTFAYWVIVTVRVLCIGAAVLGVVMGLRYLIELGSHPNWDNAGHAAEWALIFVAGVLIAFFLAQYQINSKHKELPEDA